MPRDGKHRFSNREHKIAMHVKASLKAAGKADEEAERIGWMTTQKKKRRGLGSLGRKG